MQLKSCHWLALVLLPMVVVTMARGDIQEDSAPVTAVDSTSAAKSATAEDSAVVAKAEDYYGDRPEGYHGFRNHKVRSHCKRGS